MSDNLYEGTKYENLDPKYRDKVIHKARVKSDKAFGKSAKSEALKKKKGNDYAAMDKKEAEYRQLRKEGKNKPII